MYYVYKIEMFKNTGSIEHPVLEWVEEKRIYSIEKDLNDFDLHDIPGLRRNARLIEKIPVFTPTSDDV